MSWFTQICYCWIWLFNQIRSTQYFVVTVYWQSKRNENLQIIRQYVSHKRKEVLYKTITPVTISINFHWTLVQNTNSNHSTSETPGWVMSKHTSLWSANYKRPNHQSNPNVRAFTKLQPRSKWVSAHIPIERLVKKNNTESKSTQLLVLSYTPNPPTVRRDVAPHQMSRELEGWLCPGA